MKRIVAVLASSLILGSAYAAGTAPVSTDAAEARADAKRDLRVDNHIKEMHAGLKITPAEESQWDVVAQTMRENARELDQAMDKRESAAENATAVDDLNSYADVAQAHADGVRKLAKAFSGLYSSMSADQKKQADEEFGHRMQAGKSLAK
jgi:periplasmic protein CpxP/Spy